MKNIKKYSTVAEYNADTTREYPCVSWVDESEKVEYEKSPKEQYLTFKIVSAGTIVWNCSSIPSIYGKIIYYSTDNGITWAEMSSKIYGGTSFNVNVGDKVLFKGNNTAYGESQYYNNFNGSTAYFNIEGNIMSMIAGDNFATATTLTDDYNFRLVFGNSNVVSAENLILPATTLTPRCYQSMFSGCTSLTTAPELPATTLAQGCYQYMFEGCTSLTTAPALPATTLAKDCYYSMFNNCTNLNSITSLATNISASNCTLLWVNGVSANGTFTKAASMTGWSSGVKGIPSGWTVKDYPS